MINTKTTFNHLVWGTRTSKNKEKVLAIQKRYIGIVAHITRFASIENLFNTLHILKIEAFYNFRLARHTKTQHAIKT